MQNRQNAGYKSFHTEKIPLLKCPSCKHTTDSILLVSNNTKGLCHGCKKTYLQNKFTLVEEKRNILTCKNCELTVPMTSGNIAWDGKNYICPRCRNFLISTSI